MRPDPAAVRSRPLMASTSPASRVMFSASKFSRIRDSVTDLGMTTLPMARCQAMTTWAGVAPCLSASAVMVASSRSSPPCPSGD